MLNEPGSRGKTDVNWLNIMTTKPRISLKIDGMIAMHAMTSVLRLLMTVDGVPDATVSFNLWYDPITILKTKMSCNSIN